MKVRDKLKLIISLKIIAVNDAGIIIIGIPLIILNSQIQTIFSALLQIRRKGNLRLPLPLHSLNLRTFSRLNFLTVILIHQSIGNRPHIRHRLAHLQCNCLIFRNRSYAQTQIGRIHLLNIGIHFINPHTAVFHIQFN